jgi:hypothetical protein
VTEHEIRESGVSRRRHVRVVVLTPLCFLVDLAGRQYGAPTDHAQFFYGFLSVAMALADRVFLVIGSSPAGFRPLMIPTIVEKLGHVAGVAVLYGQGRISVAHATAAAPDSLLRVLLSWPSR